MKTLLESLEESFDTCKIQFGIFYHHKIITTVSVTPKERKVVLCLLLKQEFRAESLGQNVQPYLNSFLLL